jgi:hypothetical protein
MKFKEFCVSWNKFHKNLPRDSFKKKNFNVDLYEIYSKKSKVTNTYVDGLYIQFVCKQIWLIDLIFGVLTPLSAIFQLYHGDQF